MRHSGEIDMDKSDLKDHLKKTLLLLSLWTRSLMSSLLMIIKGLPKKLTLWKQRFLCSSCTKKTVDADYKG